MRYALPECSWLQGDRQGARALPRQRQALSPVLPASRPPAPARVFDAPRRSLPWLAFGLASAARLRPPGRRGWPSSSPIASKRLRLHRNAGSCCRQRLSSVSRPSPPEGESIAAVTSGGSAGCCAAGAKPPSPTPCAPERGRCAHCVLAHPVRDGRRKRASELTCSTPGAVWTRAARSGDRARPPCDCRSTSGRGFEPGRLRTRSWRQPTPAGWVLYINWLLALRQAVTLLVQVELRL